MKKICFTLFICAFVSCLCFAQESPMSVVETTPESTSVDPTVSLLISCEGADGSRTFIDRSDNRHVVTAYGDAQISNSQKISGIGSAIFDGAGDYLTIEDSADWDFGLGDFTIDFWISFNRMPSQQIIFDVGGSQTGSLKGVGLYYANGEWRVAVNDKYHLTIKGTPAFINKWYHIAIVGSGGKLYFFKNGRLLKKTEYTDDITGSTEGVTIGTWCRRDNYFVDGWIDEFRICKGVARWKSSFSPPTYP